MARGPRSRLATLLGSCLIWTMLKYGSSKYERYLYLILSKDRKQVGNSLKIVSATTEMYPLILSERGLTVTITQNAVEPGELEDMELQ